MIRVFIYFFAVPLQLLLRPPSVYYYGSQQYHSSLLFQGELLHTYTVGTHGSVRIPAYETPQSCLGAIVKNKHYLHFVYPLIIPTPSLSLHASSPLVAPSPLSLTPTFTTYHRSKPDKTPEEHSHCFHISLTLLRCRVPAHMNVCPHCQASLCVSQHSLRKPVEQQHLLENVLDHFSF